MGDEYNMIKYATLCRMYGGHPQFMIFRRKGCWRERKTGTI